MKKAMKKGRAVKLCSSRRPWISLYRKRNSPKTRESLKKGRNDPPQERKKRTTALRLRGKEKKTRLPKREKMIEPGKPLRGKVASISMRKGDS